MEDEVIVDQIFDAIILAMVVDNTKAVCVAKKTLRLEDLSKINQSLVDRGTIFYLNEYTIGKKMKPIDVLDVDNFAPTSVPE